MDVSENSGTPKSSILIGFSIINHPFGVPLFLETPILDSCLFQPCPAGIPCAQCLGWGEGLEEDIVHEMQWGWNDAKWSRCRYVFKVQIASNSNLSPRENDVCRSTVGYSWMFILSISRRSYSWNGRWERKEQGTVKVKVSWWRVPDWWRFIIAWEWFLVVMRVSMTRTKNK